MFIILNLILKGGWKLSSIVITVAYIVESSMEGMRKLDFFMNSKKLHSYGTIQNKDVHTAQVTTSLATSGPKWSLFQNKYSNIDDHGLHHQISTKLMKSERPSMKAGLV